jgi:predicted PolB exonuclease-like 3'-5' exonuclease
LIQNIALSDLLVIDIETVPGSPHYQDLPDVWKELWLGKISKTMPENFSVDESYHDRAAILAEFGRVICISTGFFYRDGNGENCFKIKSICSDNEPELLQSFMKLVEKFTEKRPRFSFAGHNIKEFDIPYLCRRSLINGLQIPPFLQLSGMKPWETNLVDTLQLWKFGDFKNYISLRLLAAVLEVPTPKEDMDGSMVRSVYYDDRNMPRITEYCQKDVIAVANILLKFKNLPLLKEENIFVAA